MTQPIFLTDPVLRAHSDKVAHAFFTRLGGVGTNYYESLNCAYHCGDEPAIVDENRRHALAALCPGAERLVTISQVHSADVLTIQTDGDIDSQTQADAIVTNKPKLAIGILTADCTPILFFAPKQNIIGAAHAGWRGAFDGILQNTIEAMQKLGAQREDIVAVVGPCIGQTSYEVGAEFYQRFIDQSSANAVYFIPSRKPGHHQFDLPGFVLGKLLTAKIGTIAHIPEDTCAKKDLFFSHRRATLAGDPATGRLLSTIALL